MRDRDQDGWRGRVGPDSRLSLLRELGEQAVLETIFRRGPITRPEIAGATNLSKPTVSAAVSRLEQGGLVRASGRRGGQRGRKPLAYMVNSRVGFVVGGDIGGSNVRVAAADLFGEPICDLKHPTAKDSSRAVGCRSRPGRGEYTGSSPGSMAITRSRGSPRRSPPSITTVPTALGREEYTGTLPTRTITSVGRGPVTTASA